MVRNHSKVTQRLLLLFIFTAVFGLFLYSLMGRWQAIDAEERWIRTAELVLIAMGAWIVVWPEYFPSWRSSKGSSDTDK